MLSEPFEFYIDHPNIQHVDYCKLYALHRCLQHPPAYRKCLMEIVKILIFSDNRECPKLRSPLEQ